MKKETQTQLPGSPNPLYESNSIIPDKTYWLELTFYNLEVILVPIVCVGLGIVIGRWL